MKLINLFENIYLQFGYLYCIICIFTSKGPTQWLIDLFLFFNLKIRCLRLFKFIDLIKILLFKFMYCISFYFECTGGG